MEELNSKLKWSWLCSVTFKYSGGLHLSQMCSAQVYLGL